MPNELLALPAPDPSPPLEADRRPDAEALIAAFERMTDAIHGERAAFDRLRDQLDGMAHAIAEAKAAIKSGGAAGAETVDVGALLRALEQRIHAMTGVLGGAVDPVPAAAAQPAIAGQIPHAETAGAIEPVADDAPDPHGRVPTVSDVVSQLGRSSDAPAPAEDMSDAPSPITDEDVAMLEAMVEALTAPVPEDAAAAQAPQDAQPAEIAAFLAEAEAAPAEAAASPEDAAPSPPEPPQPVPERIHHPTIPEVDLLSNFARMETVPYLPAEVGTAVIFAPKPADAPDAEPQTEPAPVLELQPEPEAVVAAEPPAEAVAEAVTLDAALEAEPVAIESVTVAATPEPAPVEEPQAITAHIEPAPTQEPQAATAHPEPAATDEPPPAQAQAEPAPDDNADPADFLFEPDAEAELDPAAFLLEPAPAMARRTMMPAPVFTHAAEQTPPTPARPPQPAPAGPADPLAPLNAMSDEEKIALFS